MFELNLEMGKMHVRSFDVFLCHSCHIILILVYQVFLGQIQIDAIKEVLGSDTAFERYTKMVNHWLISGLDYRLFL